MPLARWSLLPRVLALGVSVAFALASNVAHASPLFELVGDCTGTGGLSARARGAGAASTYFNPALLPKAAQGLSLGWTLLHDDIDISLDPRESKHDVPIGALSTFGPSDHPPLPTQWLEQGCDPQNGGACTSTLPARPRQGDGSSQETHYYQTLGLVNHLWEKRLSLGFYAMIPIGSFTEGHAYFVDEREQYFSNSLHPELYGDRLAAMSLAFGAATQLLKRLSLGVSATLGLTNRARATSYVGHADDLSNELDLSTKLSVSSSVAVHSGIVVDAADWLRVSATLHAPRKMVIDSTSVSILPGGDHQTVHRKSTLGYEPWQLGAGFDIDLVRRPMHVFAGTVSGTYGLWSNYRNRQSEKPLRNYAWSDVPTGTLGLHHTYREQLESFVDATYAPTPVPAQTGRTNYVDNDRFSFDGGLVYTLPIKRWHGGLRFGGQAQLHWLPQRSQRKFDPSAAAFRDHSYPQLVVDEWRDGTKDVTSGDAFEGAYGLQTNNPGWPGFGSRGLLTGGSLSLGVEY